jgi:hypothetical protein
MLSDIQKNPNVTSWAINVKRLLETYGFYDVWLYGTGNPDLFLQVFKERVKDVFIQTWNEEISNSPRADSYRLFSSFGFKSYLDILNINKFRYDFTRLRVSAHRLNIETGRWHKPNKIPRNERKCIFCNCLEDEFHFLLECSLYTDIRKRFLKPYYWKHPNILKLISLMNTTNKDEIKNIAVFIHRGFQIRNNNILQLQRN